MLVNIDSEYSYMTMFIQFLGREYWPTSAGATFCMTAELSFSVIRIWVGQTAQDVPSSQLSGITATSLLSVNSNGIYL